MPKRGQRATPAALCAALVWTCFGAGLGCAPPAVSGASGFQGGVVVEWLDDPFTPSMRVLREFGFTQTDGTRWQVRAGQVLSGRGLPPLFRDLPELREAGGQAFHSGWRRSALIYDSAVQSMTQPWDAAQRMFFEASLTEGVPSREAKVMYALLAAQGSRWEVAGSRCYGSCHSPSRPLEWRPMVDEARVRELVRWVHATDPTLDEIGLRARTAIRATGPHIFPQQACSRMRGATAPRGGCD
jgi:hypothetical protein